MALGFKFWKLVTTLKGKHNLMSAIFISLFSVSAEIWSLFGYCIPQFPLREGDREAFAISREVLGGVAFGRRDTSLNWNPLLEYFLFHKWSQNLSLAKSFFFFWWRQWKMYPWSSLPEYPILLALRYCQAQESILGFILTFKWCLMNVYEVKRYNPSQGIYNFKGLKMRVTGFRTQRMKLQFLEPGFI